jgi:hypothetical protein
VGQQLAVADVERFVVHQQTEDLSVGDVDDRLSGFGIAVAGFSVGQRPQFVEGVEVRARQCERLALVEVGA